MIDGNNAVPLFLVAEHYTASQLMDVCKYWMSMELASAEKHKQWKELSERVKSDVKAENRKLLAAREAMRQQRGAIHNMPPGLLAPNVSQKFSSAP